MLLFGVFLAARGSREENPLLRAILDGGVLAHLARRLGAVFVRVGAGAGVRVGGRPTGRGGRSASATRGIGRGATAFDILVDLGDGRPDDGRRSHHTTGEDCLAPDIGERVARLDAGGVVRRGVVGLRLAVLPLVGDDVPRRVLHWLARLGRAADNLRSLGLNYAAVGPANSAIWSGERSSVNALARGGAPRGHDDHDENHDDLDDQLLEHVPIPPWA